MSSTSSVVASIVYTIVEMKFICENLQFTENHNRMNAKREKKMWSERLQKVAST